MIATEADLDLIVELGAEAHAASSYVALAAFHPDSFRSSARTVMESPNGAVFVTDRGCIWVMKFPLYFNHAETVANEVFWHATRNGDALRREAQAWARGSLMTLSRNAATDARLDTLIQRAGFVPVETTYMRRA